MNIFFNSQYFYNDYNLFSNYDENAPIKKILYSRNEQYSLYKGLNKSETNYSFEKYYARIFVRADTKKNIIKKKIPKSNRILCRLFLVNFRYI